MNEAYFSQSVDIIIPVYNNIELTLECIKSVYQHLAKYIKNIIIHDDCSSQHTYIELNNLTNKYSNLTLIRSEPNIGFAAGVNKAVLQSKADYLFILNSDTEILADILSPMLEILSYNPKLAAINPSGPVFKNKKTKCCTNFITDNNLKYIKTANISGYALLIKSNIFKSLGGFNSIYGRGYYEDTELSRVLINNNYELAIYNTPDISHVGQSSFNKIKTNNTKKTSNFAKELINKNQKLYFLRNPKASEKLDIYTLVSDFNKLDNNLKQKIQNIILNGGTVTIHSFNHIKNLPIYHIKYKRLKFREFLLLIFNKKTLVIK